jgi:hypothetical protein
VVCIQVRGYFARKILRRLKRCVSTAADRTRRTAEQVSKTITPRISQNQRYEKNFVKFPTQALQSLWRTYNSDCTGLERTDEGSHCHYLHSDTVLPGKVSFKFDALISAQTSVDKFQTTRCLAFKATVWIFATKRISNFGTHLSQHSTYMSRSFAC